MEQYLHPEQAGEEVRAKMVNALDRLPLRQKEAIFFIYYEKMHYEEAATIMDVNIKTVYNLVWRGIECLRKELRRKQPEK
jgi:RNA polymerase sigma factor (sigma-70 family)